MQDRELRQTVDLVATNIQEILEILPTLATKEEVGPLAENVRVLIQEVKILNGDMRHVLERINHSVEISGGLLDLIKSDRDRLQRIEAAIYERR